MRIISGKYKGRVFNPPLGLPIRPTTDRSKEALFNILSHRYEIEDKECLDLFSGSGGLAYELLSRGAKNVVLVEKDFGCLKFISETLAKLDAQNAKLVKSDVLPFIKSQSQTFDLILADPPYALLGQKEMVKTIFNRLLNQGGLFVLEHDQTNSFEQVEGFQDFRKYGKASFSFFEKPI